MDKQNFRIFISAAVFAMLIGIVIGAVTAYSTDFNADGGTELLMRDYLSSLNADNSYSVSQIFNVLFFPFASVLLAFTLFGVALIPLLLLLRGVMLSFTFTALIATYGIDGIWLALSTLSAQIFFSLPALIIISAFCAYYSLYFLQRILKKTPVLPQILMKQTAIRLSASVGLLIICIVCEVYLLPGFQQWVIARIV